MIYIFGAVVMLFMVRVIYSAGEIWFERDWPRATWRGLVIAALLLFLCFPAFGQVARFDVPQWTINTSTPQPGGLYPMLAFPNARVQVCATWTNGVAACNTLATTYTDSTGTTPCSTATQLVSANSGTCSANSDSAGGIGGFIAPGSYALVITTSYGTYGPYQFGVDAAGAYCPLSGCTFTGSVAVGTLNTYYYANRYATGGNGTSGSPYTSASGTGGIQEAINAAVAQSVISGGFAPTVYIPTGSYSVTSPITITATVNLIGAGWASQLVSGTTSQPVILIQPTVSAEIKGFTFSDFTIGANASGGCGITLDGTNNEILWGDIKHVQIYQQGSHGICALGTGGTGAPQGTPVLTTIEDSQIYGGISIIQGGDSNRVIHNTLTGTGSNDFGNVAGAVGFIFEANNVTVSGGTHFGDTFSGSSNYYFSVINNEFETPSNFTGSGTNNAMLDLDQNVVGPTIAGNSFSLIHGTNPSSINFNNAVSGTLTANKFACTNSGITGSSTGIIASASAAHNVMVPDNYFNPASPCTTSVNATSAEVQYTRTNLGQGWYIPNGQYWGAIDSSGTARSLIGLDASNNMFMYGTPGALVAKSFVADSPNYRNCWFDSSPSQNTGMCLSDTILTGGLSTATFLNASSFVLSGGTGNIYAGVAGAPVLIPGTATGHTGTATSKIVLSDSPAFTSTPTAPTATKGTNTTQIATTAFVAAALPTQGTATLAAGTVTVSNPAACTVGTSCHYYLSNCGAAGTVGTLSVGTITAGTSFVINSSSASDTSTVCWQIQ